MKRSDFYIRLTTAVLFLAVVCYIGFSLYNSAGTSFETEDAVALTVEETGNVTGYIVREERVIHGGGGGVSPVARDGEKVGAGQLLAIEYTDSGALRRAGELRAVKLRIEQLEAASAAGGLQNAQLASGSVTELAKVLREGRIYDLDSALIRVESYVLTGASVPVTDDLPSLYVQLAELEAQSAGDATVTAPVSGVFSQIVDGYEGVKPEMLTGITPSGLSELFASPQGVSDGAAGKLITGITWYYAATLDAAETRRLSVGKEVQVRFRGGYQGVVTMKVSDVSRAEDGRCVVVLSCSRALAGVSGTRRIEAEIVFDSYSGLRVPKEAIHLGDGGETFVFLQIGAQAERAEVTILTEFGDSYIAVDAGNKPLLREGVKIIVKANNIEDGSVFIG